jgi:hypothetical protein
MIDDPPYYSPTYRPPPARKLPARDKKFYLGRRWILLESSA